MAISLDEVYDSPSDVCTYLPNMSVDLLRQMRFRGDGPPYIKVSPRRIVYRRTSVMAWLEGRERNPGSLGAA